MSDNELDTLVREFREEKPNSGIRYTTGYRGSSTISFLTTSTPTVTLSVITGTPIRYPGTITIKAPWCVSSLVYICYLMCLRHLQDMRLLGFIEHGMMPDSDYVDNEFGGVHPDTLYEYYGVLGRRRRQNTLG